MNTQNPDVAYDRLATSIKGWGRDLGFDDTRITDTRLEQAEKRLNRWLELGRHGEMSYMHKHGVRRTRPAQLVPGTLRVIVVRMDYLPQPLPALKAALTRSETGYISRYALGRDYHKVMRKRLQKLADRISGVVGSFGYRAFVDSAPVMEKALAEKAGIGWIGKHTNVINRRAGSWFFLGELYTDLPLPVDEAAADRCGTCRTCMDVCPTGAIVGPYELDARRCISYLTIELRGSIPESLRPLLGNRIYGCDDCQLFCPWNRFAKLARDTAFRPRPSVTDRDLVALSAWSEADFMRRTSGSAIRRISFECWLRNIAVALGNAKTSTEVVEAARRLSKHASPLVREHAHWALGRHRDKATRPRD